MKKILFFLCCCLSICALVYMCYKVWLGISSEQYTFDLLIQILATIGWFTITYSIVTRSYSWAEKLCK
ncbi:MAG: hypothetical protein IJA04_07015 [Bacteroidaceae bacterium]|nr:hypothetical protein [Bacteroidales bacterium]MBQ2878108.1 hypothetical protein [Bacteroidaceae bacterium]MBQ3188393.1 hypothetical protein [Bacteroidaceae bacterium]MBQ3623436.1 hypothetical protein [Bacteroidaceae bacterium]